MIAGFTTVASIVAAAAGVVAILAGLAGRKPSDLSLGGAALTELLLVAQGVIAIVVAAGGRPPTGNPVEWIAYLIGALVIPPAAIVWALTERTRWSVVVVGVGCLAVAVMFVRMQIIWTAQGS